MDDISPKPRALDYAPIHRRWIDRRSVFAVALVASVAAIALTAYSRREHIRAVVLERQALAATPAPGATAYLDSRPGDIHHVPEVMHANPAYRTYSRTSQPMTAVVYVGQMRTPGGIDRLVAVEVSKWPDASGIARLLLSVRTNAPARLLALPSDFSTTNDGSTFGDSSVPGRTVRVTAGAPDPNDPSHLAVDLQLGGQKWTYDIWLRDPRPGFAHVEVLIQPREPVQVDGSLDPM